MKKIPGDADKAIAIERIRKRLERSQRPVKVRNLQTLLLRLLNA